MNQVKINYVAVALSAIAAFVIGWLWYGLLFMNQWIQYTGITMDQPMAGMEMVIAFGGSLIAYAVLFYVQSHIHHAFQVKDIKNAIMGAFWSWLGFIITVLFVTNVYQRNSFGLTILDAVYWLVCMIIGGIIIVKMTKKATPST